MSLENESKKIPLEENLISSALWPVFMFAEIHIITSYILEENNKTMLLKGLLDKGGNKCANSSV